MTEGGVRGPAGLLSWLRLINLGDTTQTIKVTMTADDGRLAPGQRPRVRTRSFTVDPGSPLTVSVHDELWPNEAANFSTLVECQDVCDAGLIVRPTEDFWNPGKVSNFEGKLVCQ